MNEGGAAGQVAVTPDAIDALIAARVLALRRSAGLSLSDLAARSGVSKAMISKVERRESSPTAAVLGRLAAALQVSLSDLLQAPEATPRRHVARAGQATWRDPGHGYLRRQVAVRDPQSGVELVEIELPRGCRVTYPPWSGRPYRQQLWLLEGRLHVQYGDEAYALDAGDSLAFAVDRALSFRAGGRSGVRYLLVICTA